MLSRTARQVPRKPRALVRRHMAPVVVMAGLGVVGTAWAQSNASAPRPVLEEQRQQERERALRQQQETAVDERLPLPALLAASRIQRSAPLPMGGMRFRVPAFPQEVIH